MSYLVSVFHHFESTFSPYISSVRESEFHGRMLRVFQPLPEEGRLRELIIRVLTVIAAPFIYLAHFIYELIGWGGFHQDREISLTSEEAIAVEGRINGISHQAKDVVQTMIADLFRGDPFSKVKLLIICRVEDRESKHELDFASGRGHLAVQDLLESVSRKFVYIQSLLANQLSRIDERGHVRIKFKGFFLTDHDFLVKDWTLNDFYDQGHRVRIPVQGSHIVPIERALEVLRAEFDDLQIVDPGFVTLEQFFGHRIYG